jgi:hypothetical protein
MAYPQGGPQYGQQGYGAPYGGGYGYGPPQVEHPQGTMVLILGILGLVLCALCAPFAWSMGNKAKRDVDAAPGRYSNAQLITIGRILGIVGSVILILQLVFVAIYIVIIVAAIGSSGSSY